MYKKIIDFQVVMNYGNLKIVYVTKYLMKYQNYNYDNDGFFVHLWCKYIQICITTR